MDILNSLERLIRFLKNVKDHLFSLGLRASTIADQIDSVKNIEFGTIDKAISSREDYIFTSDEEDNSAKELLLEGLRKASEQDLATGTIGKSSFDGSDLFWASEKTAVGTDLSCCFANCQRLRFVESMTTTSVVKMSGMFLGDSRLQYVDWSGWDFESVTDLGNFLKGTNCDVDWSEKKFGTNFISCGNFAQQAGRSHIILGKMSLNAMSYAFNECRAQRIDLSRCNIKSLGNSTFQRSSVQELLLPDLSSVTLTTSHWGEFANMANLVELYIERTWKENLSLADSSKLSEDSVRRLIMALYDFSQDTNIEADGYNSKVLTLHSKVINKLENMTDYEYLSLMAIMKGWEIA